MLGSQQLGSVFWSIVCAAGIVLLPLLLWRTRRVLGRLMSRWWQLLVLVPLRNRWVRFAFVLLVVPMPATSVAGIVLFGAPTALVSAVAGLVYVPAGAAFLVLWRRSRGLAFAAYLSLCLLPIAWSWWETARAEQAAYDERLYVPKLEATGYYFPGEVVSAQCRLIYTSRAFSLSLVSTLFCLAGLRWAVARARWQWKLPLSVAGLTALPLIYFHMPGPVSGPWRDGILGCMTHVCTGAEYWGNVTRSYNICASVGEGYAGASSGVPYRRVGPWRILWGADEDSDEKELASAIPARVGLFALWAQGGPEPHGLVIAWRYLDVPTLNRTYRYIEFLEQKQAFLQLKRQEWEATRPPEPQVLGVPVPTGFGESEEEP